MDVRDAVANTTWDLDSRSRDLSATTVAVLMRLKTNSSGLDAHTVSGRCGTGPSFQGLLRDHGRGAYFD